jgi:transposase
MIIDFDTVSLFIKPGPTDMRKQINGLTLIVQNEMRMDPFSLSLFMFCNKQRKLLKVVYWDKTGFALWYKRLEKARFPWPQTKEEALSISLEQFKLLLQGIDFFRAHKTLHYKKVG